MSASVAEVLIPPTYTFAIDLSLDVAWGCFTPLLLGGNALLATKRNFAFTKWVGRQGEISSLSQAVPSEECKALFCS